MAKAPVEIRSLARSHTSTAIRALATIAGDEDEDASPRVSAAVALLDRGWGKPATTYSGENGEGAIQVIIRHIIEGRDAPATIDHSPIVSVSDDTQD